MRIVAHLVSFLFHPLLMPLYSAIVLMVVSPYRLGYYPIPALGRLCLAIFFYTVLIPGVAAILSVRLGFSSSLRMPLQKDRILPFIATAIFYLMTYLTFRPNQENAILEDPLLAKLMLGATVAIFLAFFINVVFMKISLHAVGTASLVGLLLNVAPLVKGNTIPWLLLSIGIVGLVGTSRLILNEHKPNEVYVGYFVGFISMFISFRILTFLP